MLQKELLHVSILLCFFFFSKYLVNFTVQLTSNTPDIFKP